jgi:UDP-galactopyranose mutase
MFDYLIVGAGFAGSVLAERLASQSGKKVLIIDKRSHIGGNAFDKYDNNGILIHPYGPHIFHTNAERIFAYLSNFTEWRPYEHRVLAHVDNKLVPIPINLTTVNTLYNLNLTSEQLELWFRAKAEPKEHKRTSEDVVVSVVGRELYEKFFRGYTRKQWELDPSELDAQVTARVPTRVNTDDRYFTDAFQAMPLHGYTRMFEKMLNHPNIKIMLNTDWREVRDMVPYKQLIFTGPVDEFFDYRFGKLPYRSLHFQHETLDKEEVLPVGVVNYPDEKVPYTRITEFKKLTGQVHHKSSIVYEFPRSTGDPYYPIPKPDCTRLYNQYKELAEATTDVTFVGRLATYKYYNMDQVVAQALATYDKLTGKREPDQAPNREKITVSANLPHVAITPAVGTPVSPSTLPSSVANPVSVAATAGTSTVKAG